MTKILPAGIVFLWVIGIALAATSLMVIAAGGAPVEVYRLLIEGTWQSAYGIGQVLFKTTPLILTGLAVAIALRAGLFNVGAEGQLTVGAFATAMMGAALPPSTPRLLAWFLCIAAGFFGGALVGLVPGLLRGYGGAHEVINTIMLNFIVRAAMVGAGARWFIKESIHTAPVIDAARLPRLGAWWAALHGSAANASLLVSLLAALGMWWLLYRTKTGYRLRVVGEAPLAAETAHLPVARLIAIAMALAGGVAGLVGANFVLGYKGYYEDGFGGGVGYMGIAVAVLGRNHPLGVVAAALLFGTLSQGALAINALVPKEIIDVVVALIIIAVAAVAPEVRRIVAVRQIVAGEK